MIKKLLTFAGIFFLLLPYRHLSVAQDTGTKIEPQTQTTTPPPLAEAHRKWLEEEVSAIISDYEKKAFLSLMTFEDRENFIQSFWEDRDPTPGTKRNEYKIEYEARLKYVMENFNREGKIPPWRTTRGRTYLLMGKPMFRKRFPEGQLLYSCELWQYIGNKDYGLPETFYLLFLQKNGLGPYKIYSPAADGLESLVREVPGFSNQNTSRKTRRQTESSNPIWNYLRTIDFDLAFASLSLLPTEGGNPDATAGSGTVTSEVILGHLEDARNFHDTKRQYVERILSGRPKVDVYYSLEPQVAQWNVSWFQAPNGYFILDYAVQLPSNKFDMGQYDQEFYTSVAVEGTIQTAKDSVVIENINSSHDIRLEKVQFDKISHSPFEFLGRRLVLPGNYKFALLFRNNLSKSIATYTGDVTIPDFDSAKAPYFSPLLPVLSTEKLAEGSKGIKPFQFGDTAYYPLVARKASIGGQLNIFYQLFFPEKAPPLSLKTLTLEYDIQHDGSSVFKKTIPFSEKFNVPDTMIGSINVFENLSLPVEVSGRVKLLVRILNGSQKVSESVPAELEITPEKPLTPWRINSGIPDYDSPYNLYLLAQQQIRANQVDKASELLQKLTEQAPSLIEAKLQLMNLALKKKDYPKVLDLGRDLEIKYPKNRDLLWMFGWAYYGLDRFEDSVRFFERDRMEEPNSIQLLNVLADLYFRLDKPDRSLNMIQQSLALDPNQPGIIGLREKVNASKN